MPENNMKITEEILQELHDQKDEPVELTERQKALFRFIRYNSEVCHRKTTQREICDAIPEYKWTESNNTSDHCSTIWTDIVANNLSDTNDKIIITENYEYWIGSESETKEFINNLWDQLYPRLKRYWFYLKKIQKNGQGRIDFGAEEARVRNFIESFGSFNITEGRTENE